MEGTAPPTPPSPDPSSSTLKTSSTRSVQDSEDDTFERDLAVMLATTAASASATIVPKLPQGDVEPIFTAMEPSPVGQGGHTPSGSGGVGGMISRSISMPLNPDTRQKFQDAFFSVKNWSVSTFKSTKQAVNERLGRSNRTSDVDLEMKIDALRATQQQYSEFLQVVMIMIRQFRELTKTQSVLSQICGSLAQQQIDLTEDFNRNANCQEVISAHGDHLLVGLEEFRSALETLITQTIQDTLTSVDRYEAERLQFDAYRTEYEEANDLPREAATIARLASARNNFEQHKAIFERMGEDLRVKLRFLNDNRVRVMKRQLLFFHNAIAAYFAGNRMALLDSKKTLIESLSTVPGPEASELQEWLQTRGVVGGSISSDGATEGSK